MKTLLKAALAGVIALGAAVGLLTLVVMTDFAVDKDQPAGGSNIASAVKSPTRIFEETQFVVGLEQVVADNTGYKELNSTSSGIVTKFENQWCVVSAAHVCEINRPLWRLYGFIAHFKPDKTGHILPPEELELAGKCQPHDLCVLKFRNPQFVFPWKPAEFAIPKIGEKVVAIGWPKAVPFVISEGIVMSWCRNQFTDPVMKTHGYRPSRALEHSAMLDGGSSGGPAINGHGKVVGLNNMYRKHARENPLEQPTYLAVPADVIMAEAPRLWRSEYLNHATIAVEFGNSWEFSGATPKDGLFRPPSLAQGVMVIRLPPVSPGHYHGLRPGDIVLSCEGKKPRDYNEVLEAVMRKHGGDNGEKLALTVLHPDGLVESLQIPLLNPMD